MGKHKKTKTALPENWVPGWFGSTLTVNPASAKLQKHLKDRISKASATRNAPLYLDIDAVDAEHRLRAR